MYKNNSKTLLIVNTIVSIQAIGYIAFRAIYSNLDILSYIAMPIITINTILAAYCVANQGKKTVPLSKYYTIAVLTALPVITGQFSDHPAINFVYSSSVGLVSIFVISLISNWVIGLIPWFIVYVNVTFIYFDAKIQLAHLPSEPHIYYIIYIVIYAITYVLSSIITWNYHKQDKIMSQCKQELENIEKQNRVYSEELDYFHTEMEISSKIQRAFYPRSLEIADNEYDIYAYSKSYDKISGDYFDIFKGTDKIFFGLGDVTGHGLSSAIVSVMMSRKFKTFVKLGTEDIHEILQDIHNDLIIVNNKLMTISLGYIDGKFDINMYGNQEIPVLVTNNDCRAIIDNLEGFILGNNSFDVENIPYLKISLNRGEFIILYTDGVTEIENNAQQSFGVSGIIKYVQDNKEILMKSSSKKIVHGLLSHIKTWSAGDFQDDTTVLVIKRKINET